MPAFTCDTFMMAQQVAESRGAKPMRYLCTIIASLLLSGCWLGPQFYDVEQSVAAIPAGTYRIRHIEDPTGQDQRVDAQATADIRSATDVRVTYRPDGRAIVRNLGDSDDDPQTALLVPLTDVPGFDRLYVVEVDMFGLDRAVYGIVNVIDNGYQLALPMCDGTRRAAAGSRVIVSGLLAGRRTCGFSDRADFERAMRTFAQDPIRWTEYRRIS
jgi:hypothetical protein